MADGQPALSEGQVAAVAAGPGQVESVAGVVGKLACLVVDGLAIVAGGQAADGPREAADVVMAVGLEDRLADLVLGQAAVGKEQAAAQVAGWLAEWLD